MSPTVNSLRPLPRLLLLLSVASLAAKKTAFERTVERCTRKEGAYAVLNGSASLNATFEPLADPHGPFAHLKPEVLSKDPWIVVLHRFLSDEEVVEYDSFMFGGQSHNFQPSPAGYSGVSTARHSETAFCTGECDAAEIVQRVRLRASNVTGAPTSHFDLTQAVRYKPGMFFRKHHDNHPTFHLLPCGSRIFTLFVYLKSPEKGGETKFPELGIAVPAEAGAAVLWANTKANEDMNRYTDQRVTHSSEDVIRGEKHGLNFWVYQYEYREAWSKDCVSIQFADQLDAHLRGQKIPASPTQPGEKQTKLEVRNSLPTEVHLFWQNGVDEVYMGAIPPRKHLDFNTFSKHVWLVRDSSQPGAGSMLKRFVIGDAPLERHVVTNTKEDL